jgi:ATPases with chaperone activity, ATP-binding subunit
MRLDRFTVKSRDGLAAAEAVARRLDHQEVTSLHLLQALLDQEGGLVPALIERAGVSAALLRSRLQGALGRLPVVQGGETYIGRDLKEVLDGAFEEAERLKDEYVSTEHLLLAMAGRRKAARARCSRRWARPGRCSRRRCAKSAAPSA